MQENIPLEGRQKICDEWGNMQLSVIMDQDNFVRQFFMFFFHLDSILSEELSSPKNDTEHLTIIG